MQRQPQAILTALLLLIAGSLSIGGPLAVHHLTHDHAPDQQVACGDHSAKDNPCLPADDPAPSDDRDDCLDCELLTTVAVADTSATTGVQASDPRQTGSTQAPLALPNSADRAPRSSRGPPAA